MSTFEISASTLSGTQGIIALAAAGIALLSLLACTALAFRLRRVRRAQRLVLGDLGERDLVAHAADLQRAVELLQEYVGEMAGRLDTRLDRAESDLRGTISHRALVRYDAYNELSGRQSMSIAMLDAKHSGIVLSCIHHRDQARLYAKQIRDGRSELELSPEEEQAIEVALAAPPGDDGPGFPA